MTNTEPVAKPPTLLQIAVSVLASMFGVQTHKNRVRDFNSNSPARFIVMAVAMTVLFILILPFAVRVLLIRSGLAV